MVTKKSLALAPKQFSFWKRIVEYCGDGNRLSHKELEMLSAEIYSTKYISQIGPTLRLFIDEGLLSEDGPDEFIVKKDAECCKAKNCVAQKRGAENPPKISIVSRSEMQEIKNIGRFTLGRRWH